MILKDMTISRLQAFQGDSFADEDYARLTGKSMGGGDSKPDPTPDEGAVTTPTGPGSITVDNSTQGPGAGLADLVAVIDALPKPSEGIYTFEEGYFQH